MKQRGLVYLLMAVVAIIGITNSTMAQNASKSAKSSTKRAYSTSMDGQKIDGYRGIWFNLKQSRSGYGPKYSGGLGTYTMKHIPMAVYSKEVNRTYFVYGGAPAENEKYLLCMVGCYDHKTKKLQKPVVVYDKGVFNVDDPHDDPTIQLDKDGYIWVFVAGRGNKRAGIRYRSVKPYDISKFEYINESIMAYPQVHYHPEKGFALLFTRYDGKRKLFFQTSKDGVNWTPYQAIADIKDKSKNDKRSGHYQFSNICGEKIMTCFNRHPNGQCDYRTNIYYIESKDWGKTWTTADGQEVKVPVTDWQDKCLVRDYQSVGKNCYIKDISYGSDGNPVILYLTSDNFYTGPKGGKREWFTIHWDGKEWVQNKITESTHCYDSGSIWIENDVWTVIAPTEPGPQYWGTGGEMVMWRSKDKGKSWEIVKQLTDNSPRNHSYARRPLYVNDDFYAFWADGNADRNSISYLYFCNAKGKVFRMPYNMKKEWEKPVRVK